MIDPNQPSYTVGLCMIVKNEAHVIERCLASVKPIIHHWVIVDTGSTDGTQDVIRAFMQDVPGELHERPWKDFGSNRSEAMTLARNKADYTLVIDADECFRLAPDFSWAHLQGQDCFMISSENNGMHYHRCQLMNNRLPWRYEGVLHEYAFAPGAARGEVYPGITTVVHHDGARSTNPEKYEADARVLKRALKKEPDNVRYVFYLAQSYRDAGQLDKAIRWYQKRAKLGGWEEEVWFSLFQIAELKCFLGKSWAKQMEAYLKAYEYMPGRPEPLFAIASYYMYVEEDYSTAFLFLQPAAHRPLNLNHLYVEPRLYHWSIPLEYAVCCYHLGLHEEAVATYDRLLVSPHLTEAQKQKALENRGWSLRRD